MFREQEAEIAQDLAKKMVFLSGPRQVGKSYLSKVLMAKEESALYLNYDNLQDKKIIENQAWPGRTRFLVLDEIHKMPQWKSYLKGVWDTKPCEFALLVTGSARLETFRQSGDSLAGRFFHHRLFPVTPAESVATGEKRPLDHHLKRGGFPEPYLSENDTDAQRWRSQYLDGLIREDILSFVNIRQLKAMNLLVDLLRSRVGSPLSYQSLAEDLGIAPNTVKHFIEILEALYIVFRVFPHHRNIARSILQQPKLYFFDNGLVKEPGAALENLAALSLYRQAVLWEVRDGKSRSLRYLRTKEGTEVDFVFVAEETPTLMVEVKSSEAELSHSLKFFHSRYGLPGVQLVADLRLERDEGNLRVRRLLDWLEGLSPGDDFLH